MDKRLLLLLIPAIAILAFDLPILLTLGYSMAAMLLIAAVSHLTRKIIFPYVDMGVFAEKALQTANGAGFVFVGVSFIIGMMILGSAIWLSH
jgi:uncharacterized membrane protein (UPF0182 family)